MNIYRLLYAVRSDCKITSRAALIFAIISWLIPSSKSKYVRLKLGYTAYYQCLDWGGRRRDWVPKLFLKQLCLTPHEMGDVA